MKDKIDSTHTVWDIPFTVTGPGRRWLKKARQNVEHEADKVIEKVPRAQDREAVKITIKAAIIQPL